MGTTVSLNDKIAQEIKKEAKQSNRSFKDTINELLLIGLESKKHQLSKNKVFTINAKHCGFKAGIDHEKLNQVLDDSYINDFKQKKHTC